MSTDGLNEKDREVAIEAAKKLPRSAGSQIDKPKADANKKTAKKKSAKKRVMKKSTCRSKSSSNQRTTKQVKRAAEKKKRANLTDEDVDVLKRKAWYRRVGGNGYAESEDLVHTLESAKLEFFRKNIPCGEVELHMHEISEGQRICLNYRNLGHLGISQVRINSDYVGLIYEEVGVKKLLLVPPPLIEGAPRICDAEWEEIARRSIQFFEVDYDPDGLSLADELGIDGVMLDPINPGELMMVPEEIRQKRAEVERDCEEEIAIRDKLKKQLANCGLLEWDCEYAIVLSNPKLFYGAIDDGPMKEDWVPLSPTDSYKNRQTLHEEDPRQQWLRFGKEEGHIDKLRGNIMNLVWNAFQAGKEAERCLLTEKLSETVARGRYAIEGSKSSKSHNDVLREVIIKYCKSELEGDVGPGTIRNYIEASSEKQWITALESATKHALKNLLSELRRKRIISR